MKPIFISLFPNVERDDFFLTLKTFFTPWKWRTGNTFLEENFKKRFNVKYAFSFNSGRSALLAILFSLGLEQGDEVLIQAFTCNAAVNPILWAGLKPVFVDCQKETLNIDVIDLKKKITNKSRVLIVQHTFGLPADLNEILTICHNNNLILIEDCAHSLGAYFQGQQIGTFGTAAFFSFGRDKIISSIFGGLAITNNEKIGKNLKNFWERCQQPSFLWIFQQLFSQILIQALIKPLYNFFGIGKFLFALFQRTKIISKTITDKEKKAEKPSIFPRKMPAALVKLAENQFKKIERFNKHREKIAKIYNIEFKNLKVSLPKNQQGRVWMRYSLIFEKETDSILTDLAKKTIFLNDGWRKTVIVPADTDHKKFGYVEGDCPQAEIISKNILNLPTSIQISEIEVKKIANLIKKFL